MKSAVEKTLELCQVHLYVVQYSMLSSLSAKQRREAYKLRSTSWTSWHSLKTLLKHAWLLTLLALLVELLFNFHYCTALPLSLAIGFAGLLPNVLWLFIMKLLWWPSVGFCGFGQANKETRKHMAWFGGEAFGSRKRQQERKKREEARSQERRKVEKPLRQCH